MTLPSPSEFKSRISFVSGSFFAPLLIALNSALTTPLMTEPISGTQPMAFGTKQFFKTVPANDFEFYFDNYSSAATRGFARSYFADLGLPPSVISNLYRQPMTIRLGMRVSARGVSFGQYRYTMRLTGN